MTHTTEAGFNPRHLTPEEIQEVESTLPDLRTQLLQRKASRKAARDIQTMATPPLFPEAL